MDRQACFQFKASFSPCAILQIIRYDLEEIEKQLVETIQKAPNFFIGSPVVLDLEKIKSLGNIDFSKIKNILLGKGLVPVGVRSGTEEQITSAVTAGLPLIAIGKTAFADTKKKTEENSIREAKFINSPVRGGTQVYAKECDLIVVAQVSPGAELLSDGNIHVYGALHGRALAGVKGNKNAKIFCRTLEAELVSIAGYYLTKEEIQTLKPQEGTIQIYLEDEQVRIQTV